MKDNNYKIIDLGIARDPNKNKNITYVGDTPIGTQGYKIDKEILESNP